MPFHPLRSAGPDARLRHIEDWLSRQAAGQGVGFSGASAAVGSPNVNATSIQGVLVSDVAPTTNQVLTAAEGQWGPATPPYDVFGAIKGVPTASEFAILFVAARAFALTDYSTSAAVAQVAATASATFNILQNGGNIGTIVFGAGQTVGVFSGSGGNFVRGDVLSVVAPGVPDVTLAGVAVSLGGTLS